MKKLLFSTIAFTLVTSSFAQEAPKAQPATKKVEKKVKKVEAKPTELPAKTAAIEALSPQTIKETPIAPAQVTPAPVTPAPAPLADVSKGFEFKNDAFDFGKIPAGKPAKYDLFIKNISNEVAELTLVQPGCGCTTPEYEKDKKFAPGETVKVTLGYNGGAPGNGSAFSKSVTVTLKGYQPKIVTFRGETYAVPTESAPANKALETLKPAEPAKH